VTGNAITIFQNKGGDDTPAITNSGQAAQAKPKATLKIKLPTTLSTE
jgi:hypothetical protein